MCGCWATSSATRCGRLEGEALFGLVERARAGEACPWPTIDPFQELADRSRICRSRPRFRLPGRSRSSSPWRISPSNIIASAGAASTRATRACAAARFMRRGVRPLAAQGLSADALTGAVRSLRIELVLTAHPPEIARRTLLQVYRRIGDLLAVRDRSD